MEGQAQLGVHLSRQVRSHVRGQPELDVAGLVEQIELPERHPILGPPTLQVTVITGGVKVNVVPPECTFEVDARTLPAMDNRTLLERIRAAVGVAYGSDVDRVCQLLEQIALSHEEICADPEPRVRFRSFGDSGLNFELLGWIAEPALRGRLIHELNMDIYKVFQQEGIEIPYPKRDVYVRELPRGA